MISAEEARRKSENVIMESSKEIFDKINEEIAKGKFDITLSGILGETIVSYMMKLGYKVEWNEYSEVTKIRW